MVSVSELNFYPVKSLRGISVPQLSIESEGPAGDREFVIVDENGKFITQRQAPRLARLAVHFANETLRFDLGGTAREFALKSGDAHPVKVWSDEISAVAVSDGADAYLTEFLGRRARLMRYRAPKSRVRTSPSGHDYEVRFPDQAQVLLTNTASLIEFNASLPTPLTMDRFRANLVVDGLPAWGEEKLRRLRIGTAEFAYLKRCTRCVMVVTDQTTGEVGSKEPLLTLKNVLKPEQSTPDFGVHLRVLKTGIVRVGDEVVEIPRG